MKTHGLSATKRVGLILCIMINRNDSDLTQGNNPNGNEALQDEENFNQPGASDDKIPTGEENMPDPEEFEEKQGDENLDDIPMEDPIPDIDEIEQEDDIDDLGIDPIEEEDDIIEHERPEDEML